MKDIHHPVPIPAENRSHSFRKAARGIPFLLLLPVLFSCAFTLIKGHGDLSRMNIFGFRLSIALSGSMEPTILTDALCLTDMRAQEYKTGDIVIFSHLYADEQVSALICHRIIKITPRGKLITKGDNNKKADPWITDPEDVLGKVIWICNFFARI